jgi:hypothetical protein
MMTDPTPEALQHGNEHASEYGHDSADDSAQEPVRNIYVRRVGETLDDDGELVPEDSPRATGATRRQRKDR